MSHSIVLHFSLLKLDQMTHTTIPSTWKWVEMTIWNVWEKSVMWGYWWFWEIISSDICSPHCARYWSLRLKWVLHLVSPRQPLSKDPWVHAFWWGLRGERSVRGVFPRGSSRGISVDFFFQLTFDVHLKHTFARCSVLFWKLTYGHRRVYTGVFWGAESEYLGQMTQWPPFWATIGRKHSFVTCLLVLYRVREGYQWIDPHHCLCLVERVWKDVLTLRIEQNCGSSHCDSITKNPSLLDITSTATSFPSHSWYFTPRSMLHYQYPYGING